jgi:protein O-GlcNAc transferase
VSLSAIDRSQASLAEAMALHRAGDRAAAERLYRRALVGRPNDPETLHGFGVLCHETGRASEALTLLGRAVQLAPSVAQYVANLGGVLSKLKHYDQAIPCLRHALKNDPRHPDAARNLALALMEAGQPGEARAPLMSLLRATPERADLWRLLGRAERMANQYLPAAAACRRVTELAPKDYRGWDGLGLSLDQLGDGLAAVAAFHQALTLKPDDAETLCHLGIALRRQHRFAEALAAAGRALALEPNRAEAHHLQGTIHQERGEMALAAPFYLRAAELLPSAIETLSNLGTVLVRLDQVNGAIEAYRKVLALNPGHESATAGLYAALRAACDWQAADALEPMLTAQTAAALAAGRRPAETPLAHLSRASDPGVSLAIAGAWTAELGRRAQPPLSPPAGVRASSGRIRLGYLSSDFRDHAVAQLSAAVFGLHDRGRFEVTAYCANPDDGSPQRRRMLAGCERMVDAQPLSDRQLAARIAEDGIDILIDLNGITGSNRLGALAFRPARVQATWLGFPGTTGARFIDYCIADPIVAPAEHQRFFAEQICRLPHCYLPHDPQEDVAADAVTRMQYGLPDEGLVFCSFNQPQKIDRATFGIWMGLLGEVPGSLMWMHAHGSPADDHLRRAVASHDIDPRRLVFADKPPKALHLRRLALADVALDTRIYNGHTTSLDALFAGVPLVSERGGQFAARVGASALMALGLPGLVAQNAGQYTTIALKLARDPEARLAIRSALAALRNRGPLFDAPRFVRNLERAYEIMVARHARGEAASPIDVRDEG